MRAWRTMGLAAAIFAIVSVAAFAQDGGTEEERVNSDGLIAATIGMLRVPQPNPEMPYAWSNLDFVPTVIWETPGPRHETSIADAESFVRLGSAELSGRRMRVVAIGTEQNVVTITLADAIAHRASDALGRIARSGITVVLARCGKVSSKEDTRWYWLRGQGRPSVLEQSIRDVGTRVEERFTLNLTNTLKPREKGELDAGRGRCT